MSGLNGSVERRSDEATKGRRVIPGRLSGLSMVVAALLAAAHGPAGLAQDKDEDEGRPPKLEDIPRLTVRGEAELMRPADQLRISIGVVTEGPEAGPALRDNNKLMTAVVKAIEKVGLDEDEYETGRFRIRPLYSRRGPREPDPDWKPQIIGYEVTNTVAVRTKKLDKAGDIIAAANSAGANTIEVTGFDLADPRKYRSEAIHEAARNAMADAAALADATSLNLVRILSINLDQAPALVPEAPFAVRSRAMAADTGGAPPLSPGDVTVRASVTIVYEIAPRP